MGLTTVSGGRAGARVYARGAGDSCAFLRCKPVPASSRVNPLPQDYHRAEHCTEPVGAGLPAKRPAQAPYSGQAD
ncbi:hypothetical protein DBB42_01900 [Pseudomonas plecoglossicida]|uniref:Uncharacterized protein n=1 Tax=Pseudomonas plecoglossicida TaxID=70775 RepID=A0A2R7UTJ6_PSEDL|nr:hypothetical protein DBB42_01900 [Pseudomonas plecoglossicida]